jgi:S-(hydroxymethyl)glutathione dehydrogenase / alcohol dehydrogenase
MDDETEAPSQPSRRQLLAGAVLAAGAAAGAVAGGQTFAASSAGPGGASPSGATAGRRFRALVSFDDQVSVEQLRLLPVKPMDVVVRVECVAASYTIMRAILNPRPPGQGAFALTAPKGPMVLGQGVVGVVEEVGAMVKRVRVGERVLVSGSAECGQCYQCVQGRPDWCQHIQMNTYPYATLADGTPVTPRGGIGGLAEMTIAPEEHCVPLHTNLPGPQLALLGLMTGCGVSAAMNLAPVEPGSDVVVFGCGPVGLGAVQGARIKGASQVIAIEPIAARRALAARVGATIALDPNAMSSAELVERVRALCKGPNDNTYAGGRIWNSTGKGADGRGADFVIEAVGGTSVPPKAEAGPDPTGILPMQQAWQVCRTGGHVTYLGIGQTGTLNFPPTEFAVAGRTLHAGQQGGQHPLRDIPRYVKLMETGQLDIAPLVTRTWPLERALEAFQAVGERSAVGAVITPV